MSALGIVVVRLTSFTCYPLQWPSKAVSWLRTMRERRLSAAALSEAKGITLLREWLTPEQRVQFEASKSFDVIGCHTGHRYRISLARGTNVQELDDAGRPVMGWCFVPYGDLVAGDVVLAQKVALETDERAALTVAKKFGVYCLAR